MKNHIISNPFVVIGVTLNAQTVKMTLGATYAEYNLPVAATNTATTSVYFNSAVHQPATQDLL